MMTNPKISGGNSTSDLEARLGTESDSDKSQGILDSVELHSDKGKRVFTVGEKYAESVVLLYMKQEIDSGNVVLYTPVLNGHNVSRLHFKKVKEKGVWGTEIFGQTKYVLKRIEEKTAEQNTTRKEEIAVICNENGDICREFMPGGLYPLATLDQYLVSVNSCPPEKIPKDISNTFSKLNIFESAFHNGNGHYYLFVQPNPERESYVFISAIKKDKFNEYEKDTTAKPLEKVAAAR